MLEGSQRGPQIRWLLSVTLHLLLTQHPPEVKKLIRRSQAFLLQEFLLYVAHSAAKESLRFTCRCWIMLLLKAPEWDVSEVPHRCPGRAAVPCSAPCRCCGGLRTRALTAADKASPGLLRARLLVGWGLDGVGFSVQQALQSAAVPALLFLL